MIKFNVVQNTKSKAWDEMGDMFWRLGDSKIKPASDTIDEYLIGIKPNSPCCIVGASTFSLIKSAISRDLDVTVIDFSERMCSDLEDYLGSQKCKVVLQDILTDLPEPLCSKFSYVMSDRLINRLNVFESRSFIKNVSQLLSIDGELRTTIRMGLYDLDQQLIAFQKKHNITPVIYDEINNTINFNHAEKALIDIVPKNGDIPQEVLMRWYLNRGLEARYTEKLIDQLFQHAETEKHQFDIHRKIPTQDGTPSIFYKIIWQMRK